MAAAAASRWRRVVEVQVHLPQPASLRAWHYLHSRRCSTRCCCRRLGALARAAAVTIGSACAGTPVARSRRRQPKPSVCAHGRVQVVEGTCTRRPLQRLVSSQPATGGSLAIDVAWKAANRRRPQCWVGGGPLAREIQPAPAQTTDIHRAQSAIRIPSPHPASSTTTDAQHDTTSTHSLLECCRGPRLALTLNPALRPDLAAH
jgi:hypothetical protein